MGTPAPPNSPDGVSHFCWTPGYNFNPAPSKQLILVEFSGIEKTSVWAPGDGALQNSIYTLKQLPAPNSETWLTIESTNWIVWTISAGLSYLEMANGFNPFQFVADVADDCLYEYENELTENGINSFHKGTAKIWIEGFNL